MNHEAQRAAEKLAELILSHGEKTEATALPFWYIAVKGGSVQGGRNVILRGVWFNREAAEDHLKAKAHRYPKTAFVYCDSGHDSWHWKNLYEYAREVLADREPEPHLRPGDIGYRMKPQGAEEQSNG